jgi:hypothetical protein
MHKFNGLLLLFAEVFKMADIWSTSGPFKTNFDWMYCCFIVSYSRKYLYVTADNFPKITALSQLYRKIVWKQCLTISISCISPHQSGFIRGDSTVNQLVYLYNDICQAFAQGIKFRAVFCNISKAFDRLWHWSRSSLQTISSLGVIGSRLRWLSSYICLPGEKSLYIVVETPLTAATSLNSDLDRTQFF